MSLVSGLSAPPVRLALLALTGAALLGGHGGRSGSLDRAPRRPQPNQTAVRTLPRARLPRHPVDAGRLDCAGDEGVSGGKELPVLGDVDVSMVRVPGPVAGVVDVEVLCAKVLVGRHS